MKIVDVVCSKARTGFFFDDQRAIKKGAVADGAAYFGETVTPGFKSVRQAGEAISVMLILEDGQIAWGDCAAVQYSGAGGRDPLFLAEDFIPIIEKYIKGAVADGAAYFGETVTPGFKSVRQAGEAISVMLILEDGQIAWGDCAAVQYSGAGGRDPLFLAEDFIPIIEKYIKPELVGKEADSFKGLCEMLENIQVDGKRLHTLSRRLYSDY